MSNTPITTLRAQDPSPSGLVWENPPARAGKPGRYAGITAALKERSGEWALIRTYDTSKRASGFAQAIRTGKLVDFRETEWAAQVHTVDGAARVYVRHVGAATTLHSAPEAVA